MYKAAIVHLPEMKSDFARLKSTLSEYAKLKAALGQIDEASRLEAQASQGGSQLLAALQFPVGFAL